MIRFANGATLNDIQEYMKGVKRYAEEQEAKEVANASDTIRTIINRKDSEIRALQHDIDSLKAKLYDEMCKHG